MKGEIEPQPPPYDETTNAQPPVNRQFPPSFGLYTESMLGRKMMLGAHQSQPLYAVSVHSGWSGKPSTILHSGPSDKDPPLATADTFTFGRSSTVELPPLAANAAGGVSVEHVTVTGVFHKVMSFVIEVAATGQRESFEWRHSRGSEVAALGASHSGWKLVRLGTGEVVAAWANSSMSITKQLQFHFLGSGANGILGERWAVMAVITALRMWDMERRQRSSAAGASGGGGGGG